MSVHSGSKTVFGLIEIIRASLRKNKYIELVHRIDKNTSGLILLSKKKSLLKDLHNQFRNNDVNKQYLALVHGRWNIKNKLIKLPLFKKNKKSVIDFYKGKMSYSYITIQRHFKNNTLIKIRLLTGRHHQIRSQVAYLGHPIVFDDIYGSFKLDKNFTSTNNFLKKNYLFLHSYSCVFFYNFLNKKIKFFAPLNRYLIHLINKLK